MECWYWHKRDSTARFTVTWPEDGRELHVCKTHLSSAVSTILAIASGSGGAQFVTVTRVKEESIAGD